MVLEQMAVCRPTVDVIEPLATTGQCLEHSAARTRSIHAEIECTAEALRSKARLTGVE
jgi:hypothetical protein